MLQFFDVSKQYVEYLTQIEQSKRGYSKIPKFGYEENEKFICGIVLEMNGCNYYAPISSFNQQQKSNIVILDTDGTPISSIRFSFMFPVPESEITVRDFSKEDPVYQRLLQKEYKFCNNHQDEISKRALKVYNNVINDYSKKFTASCCDFKLLEYAMKNYKGYSEAAPTSEE